jgi:hypothetical protein
MTSELVSMLDLDAHQESVSFYRAILILESDVFEAFAPTEQEARSFLISGLENHGKRYDLGSYWYEHYLGLVQVRLVAFGDCLRTENL